MEEPFTIRIHNNLLRHLLADDNTDKKPKKKTKKPKPKTPQQPKTPPLKTPQVSENSDALKRASATGWPLQQPHLYMPIPPPPPANPEVDAIRSVLHESEKVVEKLQKQEENMLQEVTEKAKELHETEFKLPSSKVTHCSDERNGCVKCYRENLKDPLKCAELVQEFASCARRLRQYHQHA